MGGACHVFASSVLPSLSRPLCEAPAPSSRARPCPLGAAPSQRGGQTHLSPRCQRMVVSVTLGGHDRRIFVLYIVLLSAVSALWALVLSAWTGASPPVVDVVRAIPGVPTPGSPSLGRVPVSVLRRKLLPGAGSCSGSCPPELVRAGPLYWPAPVGVACLVSSAWWGTRVYCCRCPRLVTDTPGVTRSGPV